MIINEIDLFKDIGIEPMSEIAEICKEENYKEGTVIFEQNEETRFLYILQSGKLDLIVKNGANLTFRLKKSGELFGWTSLGESVHHIASAMCATDVTALKIEENKLRAVFKRHPDVGLKIMRRLVGIIAQRLSSVYNGLQLGIPELG